MTLCRLYFYAKPHCTPVATPLNMLVNNNFVARLLCPLILDNIIWQPIRFMRAGTSLIISAYLKCVYDASLYAFVMRKMMRAHA